MGVVNQLPDDSREKSVREMADHGGAVYVLTKIIQTTIKSSLVSWFFFIEFSSHKLFAYSG